MQFPIGSPAIDDDPQAPLNPDAPVGEAEEPEVVLPAEGVPEPLGEVGVRSFDVFSNPQPVTRIDASNIAIKEVFFMVRPNRFARAHTSLAWPSESGARKLRKTGRAFSVSHN